MILENMSLEDKSRQARRSPSPLDPGGAPASQSSCSQPASSLQYLNALEEAWSEEQELSTTSHSIGLQESVGQLVLLIDSFNKGEPNSLQLSKVHVRDGACRDKLAKEKGAKQKTPTTSNNNSLNNKNKTRGEEQKRALPGVQLTLLSLRGSLISFPRRGGAEQHLTSKNNSLGHNNNSLGTGNNSLGTGEQERPPKRPWRILVDTGAELSVAPRSFAETTQLSPCEKDLQLRTASGIAIQTFGMRTVQLLCQGFSFTMTFVIADVEQPLLGLSSLLRHNLSLHLDSNLGHHLGNTAGDKIQLEQRGQQIYLVACPAELGLNPCMIGNLLDNSLSPEAKNLGHEVSLDKGVLEKGGANSFSLGHKQHKPTKNKTAIGQQTALPRAKPPKQKGQQKAVSKLRTAED